MKKITAVILLTVLAAASVLSGCGKKDAENNPPANNTATQAPSEKDTGAPKTSDITITLLHHYSEQNARDWLDQIAQSYMEKTGVEIDIQATGADNYQTLLQTKISGGDAPDIFVLGTESFPAFTANGYLADLTGEEFWSNMVDGLKEGTGFDGRNYYIPMEPTASGAIYNKDVFEQLAIDKIPETYSEYIAMLEKIKDAGIVPVAVASKEWWTIVNDYRCDQLAHLLKLDSEWMTKKETRESKFINDTDFMKSLEAFKERYRYTVDDPFGTDWSTACQMVGNGEAAMLMMGSFGIGAIKDKVPDANLGMFPIPVNDNPADTIMPISTTAGFVAFADSPRLAEAKDFLNYLASVESGNLWIDKTNRMTNIKGTKVPDDPAIADIYKYQESGKMLDISSMQIDFRSEYTAAQVDAFSQYLLGQIATAEEAAQLLDNKFDEIAAKNN